MSQMNFVPAVPSTRASMEVMRENAIIDQALVIMEMRWRDKLTGRQMFDTPQAVKTFLQLRIGQLEHEEFAVVFLDNANRLIELEVMFRGTVNQTSVYPREVVKAALRHNASSVVLSHNHPSGTTEASRADEMITQTLKAALAMVDVRVLDHIIVSPIATMSFAERGLL